MNKHTDETYLAQTYWENDDLVTSKGQKLVVTRKLHPCASILSETHEIPVGSRVICETAIDADHGHVSCYICLPCADEYIAMMDS